MSAHPAVSTARRAMAAVTAGDRAAWLDCYADDAVVEDPVGGSPLDPDGAGLRGRAALEGFWDLAVAPNEIRFDVSAAHGCGAEAALVATVHGRYASGAAVSYDGVFVYTVGADARIRSLRAFWDLEPVMTALSAP